MKGLNAIFVLLMLGALFFSFYYFKDSFGFGPESVALRFYQLLNNREYDKAFELTPYKYDQIPDELQRSTFKNTIGNLFNALDLKLEDLKVESTKDLDVASLNKYSVPVEEAKEIIIKAKIKKKIIVNIEITVPLNTRVVKINGRWYVSFWGSILNLKS